VTNDRLVSGHAILARELWRQARSARSCCWPDVASGYEDKALRQLRLARWTKTERIKAGVYGQPKPSGVRSAWHVGTAGFYFRTIA